MQNIFIILLSSLFWLANPEKIQEEKSWPDELNTAKDVAYLSDLEKEVIYELNKVRSNPKQFAEEYLEELRASFEGKTFIYPGRTPVNSVEGVFPLNECIQALKKTEPVSILKPAEGLARAASILAEDQMKHGGIGHISRNGASPKNRIERFGHWDICSSEDITYGSFEARQIVIALLIDDGVPDRGHRKNILNECSHFVGVSFGGHPSYQSMCVIDYAGEYKTK
ncbi:MAG: CAP domain-containing protein [Prolixibacteraceae bacterium]